MLIDTAEYQTLMTCTKLMHKSAEIAPNLPAIASEIDAHIQSKHHFNLLHGILKDADFIVGASLDIPDNIPAARDQILWDIALNNGEVTKYFMSIPDLTEASLNKFGDLLEELEANSTDDDGIIESLLDGTTALSVDFFEQHFTLKVGKHCDLNGIRTHCAKAH